MKVIPALAIAVALLGCGSKKDDAGCDAAGQAVKDYWTKKAAAVKSDGERDFAQSMAAGAGARITSHCRADGWADDVIACLKAGDPDACTSKLTPEQMDKLKADTPKLTAPQKMQ